MDAPAMEKLLVSFATSALGLELKGRIEASNGLHKPKSGDLGSGDCTRVTWNTEHDHATLCAVYDETQSHRVRAYVLRIAWWIGAVHHEGWWHCYPKFPRDWIKGIGRA